MSQISWQVQFITLRNAAPFKTIFCIIFVPEYDCKMDTILGIESSCDDTSAAVIQDGVIRSNVIAGQAVHERYGGVVPELASRAHQQNIIPVVHDALEQAGVSKEEVSAVAFTRGPGLLGSLLVGTSFAKGFSSALGIPLIEINHLQAHVLAHFIKEDENDTNQPSFPFLCLLVSGEFTNYSGEFVQRYGDHRADHRWRGG